MKNGLIKNIELKAEIKDLNTRHEKSVELPCKVGDTVYRICPKCNNEHNNSCRNCAWAGCITDCGCDVYGLWNDGKYPAKNVQ